MAEHKWTPKQCEILARAARRDESGIGIRGPGENAAASILEKAGLGQFNAFPGSSRFWISDVGRAAIPAALTYAGNEAARLLGNANDATERGKADKARKLMDRCQEWHDAETLLRGDAGTAA